MAFSFSNRRKYLFVFAKLQMHNLDVQALDEIWAINKSQECWIFIRWRYDANVRSYNHIIISKLQYEKIPKQWYQFAYWYLKIVENQDKKYQFQFFTYLLSLALAGQLYFYLMLDLPADLTISLTIRRIISIAENVVFSLFGKFL